LLRACGNCKHCCRETRTTGNRFDGNIYWLRVAISLAEARRLPRRGGRGAFQLGRSEFTPHAANWRARFMDVI